MKHTRITIWAKLFEDTLYISGIYGIFICSGAVSSNTKRNTQFPSYISWLGALYESFMRLPWWLRGKESACQRRRLVQSLGQEDPLEKKMAAHSIILVWETPWTEDI